MIYDKKRICLTSRYSPKEGDANLLYVMLKIYLRQAWALLKQNPLFSGLYIVGTGLAIAMTMIVAEIYYVKLAPVYPEENRGRTLYITSARFQADGSQYWASLSYRALQDWVLGLENAEVISATKSDLFAEKCYIQPADRSGDFHPATKLTDPQFFRIYPLRFLEGAPFTESDLRSGLMRAVITDDLSRRLFGTVEGVVGRTFSLNYVECRVCGVVKSGSYLTEKSYAQVYLPYSVVPGYADPLTPRFPYVGQFNVTFLVKDDTQAEALRAEVKDVTRRLNLEHKDEWEMDLWEQPTSHQLSVFNPYPSDEFDFWAKVRYFGLILLVLLLVPSLNLSGMIASRMESRLAEMGVRKSFGARRSGLLSQVMWENLVLTLLGGALGLLVAWLVLYVGREWIFMLLEDYAMPVPEEAVAYVSGEMLFAPLVFLCALVLCVLLNLLSALLPAWMSLRKPIVNSLYERR